MRRTWIGWRAATLALAAGPAESAPAAAREHDVLACRLDAFDAGERARHDELVLVLQKSVREVRELPDGYAFRLPGDARLLAEIGEWVALERRCCPFLDFDLRWSRSETDPWLRLTGAKGVKGFLAGTGLIRKG